MPLGEWVADLLSGPPEGRVVWEAAAAETGCSRELGSLFRLPGLPAAEELPPNLLSTGELLLDNRVA